MSNAVKDISAAWKAMQAGKTKLRKALAKHAAADGSDEMLLAACNDAISDGDDKRLHGLLVTRARSLADNGDPTAVTAIETPDV
jgi:hypothetical protein